MLRSLAFFALVAVVAAPAAGGEPKIRVPGIYSDLHYVPEAGDLLGTELFLVPDGQGYTVFVQSDEGGLGPVAAVPATVQDDRVHFVVLDPSLGAGTYDGRISRWGFDGTLTLPSRKGPAHQVPLHLKRKKSYWQ